MPNLTCPACASDLDDDFFESSGRSECPFCGVELSQLSRPAPATDAGQEQVLLPPVPPKSILEVVEATPQRRVFYIPGGRAASIGCFALVWNGFMTVFTGMFVGAMINANEDWRTILGVFAFISLFWIIGLGLAIWWIKAKFERLFLLLEPQRLVIQRVLFGRKKMKTINLTSGSRAELVESYKENDNPVYRIEIEGQEKTAKFGTALNRDEKNWLVDRINEFLHPYPDKDAPAEPPKFCSSCGARLDPLDPDDTETYCQDCGHRISLSAPGATSAAVEEDLDSAEIPQPPEVTILEQTDDHLRFSLPSCAHPFAGWIILGVTIVFSGIFLAVALGQLLPADEVNLFDALFAVPFMLGGLIPISFGLFFIRGRITVDLTPERLKARYHLGLLGRSKSAPTTEISRVKLADASEEKSRIRGGHHQSGPSDAGACVVQSGDKSIPLTLIHHRDTARFVTQLVRRQLRRMGVELAHA